MNEKEVAISEDASEPESQFDSFSLVGLPKIVKSLTGFGTSCHNKIQKGRSGSYIISSLRFQYPSERNEEKSRDFFE